MVRVRMCAIGEAWFAADAWLAEPHALWVGHTDRLERFVTSAHAEEPRR